MTDADTASGRPVIVNALGQLDNNSRSTPARSPTPTPTPPA
ncbi:hypothetical protein [Streptomyces sp. NPDC002172]